MNKISLLLLFFLFLGGVFFVGCTSTQSTGSSNSSANLKITNVSPYALEESVSGSAVKIKSNLPSDLQLNVTFDFFKISSDGTNWETLTSSPITINLLDSSLRNTTGTSANINPPSSGKVFKYLKMGISAIYFSQTGKTNRDVLSLFKVQDPNQDWQNIVMDIVPFSYTSGEIKLNMYMPTNNISGDDYDTYFPKDGPIFNFIGGGVSETSVAKFNINIPSDVAQNYSVFVGAFRSIERDIAPSFTGKLTNNGDGSATGILNVPSGNWYIMAFSTSGDIGVNGPESGEMFTVGGVAPWESTSKEALAGQTTTVTLSKSSAPMGEGGIPQAPEGTASIELKVVASSPVTVSNASELYFYAFASTSEMSSGNAPDYFLGAKSIATGQFTETTYTVTKLSAGDYAIVTLLDLNSNGQPDTTDYVGFYGSGSSPTVVSLGSGEALDLTANPIYLQLYSNVAH